MLNRYGKVGSSCLIVVIDHLFKAEVTVNTLSAVETALERMNVYSIVTPTLVILSKSRLFAVCKFTLRHIRCIDTANG